MPGGPCAIVASSSAWVHATGPRVMSARSMCVAEARALRRTSPCASRVGCVARLGSPRLCLTGYTPAPAVPSGAARRARPRPNEAGGARTTSPGLTSAVPRPGPPAAGNGAGPPAAAATRSPGAPAGADLCRASRLARLWSDLTTGWMKPMRSRGKSRAGAAAPGAPVAGRVRARCPDSARNPARRGVRALCKRERLGREKPMPCTTRSRPLGYPTSSVRHPRPRYSRRPTRHAASRTT
jgi:hypothetical protein